MASLSEFNMCHYDRKDNPVIGCINKTRETKTREGDYSRMSKTGGADYSNHITWEASLKTCQINI